LETYATCGFKYYMRRVLGIDTPDSITREPHAGDRGSFIHDVLEHYYQSLQSKAGEPVNLDGPIGDRESQLLSTALSRLDDAFEEYDSTGFHDEWLTKVLAGLGEPASNPYYGPDETTPDGQPVARGLFYRFLHHEAGELAKATAQPTWFEARIGTPHTGGTPVQDDPALIDTPHGSVPIHGLIDRVETVPGTTPTQLVVRDYKTGSNIPSARDALLGVKFQLPLYALMAEDAFDDVETVGGAYYQVAPPDSVNSRKGLVTSQEMAAYARDDDPSTPLLRYAYPDIETHDAFRQFIETQTPQRLGTLTTALSQGRFHPTVLDPSDAGCRYCDYAHVCDVRPHRRRETMDRIEARDETVYVPPMARDLDVADVVEVE
jgi:ATP-dependent helicase/nuclease subunit B